MKRILGPLRDTLQQVSWKHGLSVRECHLADALKVRILNVLKKWRVENPETVIEVSIQNELAWHENAPIHVRRDKIRSIVANIIGKHFNIGKTDSINLRAMQWLLAKPTRI